MRLTLIAGGLLAFVMAAAGQDPDASAAGQPTSVRRLRGIRTIRLTSYSEGDFVSFPSSAPSSRNQLWLYTTGGSGEVFARFGRLTQFAVRYRGGYSYNQRYGALNGANHHASLELQTDPASRTVLSFGVIGEAGLVSDALFDPSYTMRVAQEARSINDLSQGLLAPMPETLLDSAVELAMNAGRRRSGGAHISVTRSHTRRLSTRFHALAVRELHIYSPTQPVANRFPNVTTGSADASLLYSLTRRTQFVASLAYARTYSRSYPTELANSEVGLEKQVGLRSFISVRGGYVRNLRMRSSFDRNSYSAAGVYGTTFGRHTVGWTFRRAASDTHALGAQSNISGNGAWSWRSRTDEWRLGAAATYERLNGSVTGNVDAWVGQASIARRMSSVEIALTAIYLGYAAEGAGHLSRAGARLSVTWSSEPPR